MCPRLIQAAFIVYDLPRYFVSREHRPKVLDMKDMMSLIERGAFEPADLKIVFASLMHDALPTRLIAPANKGRITPKSLTHYKH